jgi:hypothetical protein
VTDNTTLSGFISNAFTKAFAQVVPDIRTQLLPDLDLSDAASFIPSALLPEWFKSNVTEVIGKLENNETISSQLMRTLDLVPK